MAIKELCEYRIFQTQHEMEKALATLKGILDGIACDGIIDIHESSELKRWADLHKGIAYKEPLNSILFTVTDAVSDGILTLEEYNDIVWACDQAMSSKMQFDPSTIAIQMLHGIMHGILSNGTITDDEIGYLQNWTYEFEFLKGSYPYDELDSLITSILSDGKITDDERNLLKVFFSDFVQLTPDAKISADEMQELKNKYCITGICATCPDIIFENLTFCFTGVSSHHKRYEIAEKITQLGGSYIDRVSSKTDYLIIGNKGNPCFAYSCYGRKVEQAVNMRKQGENIILVHENDFWDATSDFQLESTPSPVKIETASSYTPTNPSSYTLEDAVCLIETAPENSQRQLFSFLNNYLFGSMKLEPVLLKASTHLLWLIDHNILDCISVTDYDLRLFTRNEINELVAPYVTGKGYKNGRSLTTQLEWIQTHIPQIIEKIGIPTNEVVVNQKFQKIQRKIYTYLSGKYTTDTYFDGEDWVTIPHGCYYVASLPLNGTDPSLKVIIP